MKEKKTLRGVCQKQLGSFLWLVRKWVIGWGQEWENKLLSKGNGWTKDKVT